MARKLTNSNAHFQQGPHAAAAGRRLEFPLLGRRPHDLRQARARRARHRHRRQRLRRLSPGLRPGDPRLRRSARRRGGPRRHGGRRRVRAVDRARIPGRRAHPQDGAGGRTGALFQFRHRGGHGGPAPGARLHRPGRLHHPRGRLPRPVRRGHVVHADGEVEPGRRSADTALQRGHSGRAARLRALRAGERCQPARGRVQAHGRAHRLHADRADHGQLPGHRRRARIPARGAQPVRQVRHGAAHR